MSNYITEAFKQLNLLESEDISLDASGIEELRSFLDDAAVDPDEEMMDIYDLEAEAKEDLQKSYEGKVVLECTVCHSHIFEDKENISMDDDGEACKDIECPYCMSNEGYFILGEIAPFNQEEADAFAEDEEVDLPEVDVEGAVDDIDEEDIVEESLTEEMKLDGVEELYDNDEIRGVEELEGVDELEGVEALHGPKHEDPINESCDKSLKEDFDDTLDAFYAEFDPDGDYENGFAAHTEDELDEWIYWCENQGVDFDYDFANEDSDRGYYAYLTINESLKSKKRKSLKESKTPWVVSSDVDGEIARVESESEAKATIAQMKRDDKKTRKGKKVTYSYKLDEGIIDGIANGISGGIAGSILGAASDINESIEDVTINTEDETMTMTTKEDGGVVVETSPKESFEDELDMEDSGEEMIVPITDETSEVIDVATDALDSEDEEDFEAIKDEMEESEDEFEEEPFEDEEFEEFDEESFNGLGESYLKRCYENVKGFKTTNVSSKGKKLFVEGIIKFDSGNIKETQFVFESLGNGKFEGYNKQISRGKKTYKLSGSVKNNKLVCESLNYNYRSKNELNESVRVYGTIKRK